MPYPDVAEILGEAGEPDDELRLRVAIAAVEQFCRQRFDSTGDVETRTFDGNGTTTVYLDQRLFRLDGAKMGGNALEVATLGLDSTKTRLGFGSVEGSTWAMRAVAEMEFGERPRSFDPGTDNIAVSGIWGWTEAEWAASGGELQAVRDALKLTVQDLRRADDDALSETIKAARFAGISHVSQGGLSVDLSGSELNLSRRVKLLLVGSTPSGEPLRFPAGAGALV